MPIRRWLERTRTPIPEPDLPTWEALPDRVREDFANAGITPRDFLWFGRRRGDALNFHLALGVHGLWDMVTFTEANAQMGFNGMRFHPRHGTAALATALRDNPGFTDLNRTLRGRYNGLLHPEFHNFSENVPHVAPLHFNFDDGGTVDVHFDYWNAHAPALFPILAHALWEYPLKFLVDFSNAEDIRRALRDHHGRDPWGGGQ